MSTRPHSAENPPLPKPRTPEEWLRFGHGLEAGGEFSAAVAAYDEAIAGLRRLPSPEAASRALGVCWMNRGNALQKTGTAANLTAAVAAYDESIARFAGFEHADPASRNHLGAVWLNRGHACAALGDVANGEASLQRAIGVLEGLPLDADVSYRLNLAGAWTNLAHLHHDTAPDRARDAARAAVSLVAGHERTHCEILALSLRARRALVIAIGRLLMQAESTGGMTTALANEATDAIDEGLALVVGSEAEHARQVLPLGVRLLQMGAQLYRVHQPHFLAEFVIETLSHPVFAAAPEARTIAREAIERGLEDMRRPQTIVAGPQAQRLLETSASLRAAQARLASADDVPVLS